MHRLAILLAPVVLLSACQSTPMEEDSFESRFAKADINKDGKLSREEVSDFVVHNIFDARDANSDGKLSPTEWWPDNDAEQRAMFNKRDTNKDGFVSLSEALAWGRANKGWGDIMKEADANSDGFVSATEAKAYIASKEGPAR
jgi:Ca2+-binding EF-hand superfamily protein